MLCGMELCGAEVCGVDGVLRDPSGHVGAAAPIKDHIMMGKHLHPLTRESCNQYYHQVHLVGGDWVVQDISACS